MVQIGDKLLLRFDKWENALHTANALARKQAAASGVN
jgi:hypothetical protein